MEEIWAQLIQSGVDGFYVSSKKVRRLKIGELIKDGDLYLSTSGVWEPTPITGLPVLDNGVYWVRPLKEE